MEGELNRCRGLFGLNKKKYWFKLDEEKGTLSYAEDKGHIENPIAQMELFMAKVEQKCKKIIVKPFPPGELVLQANSEGEAMRWYSSFQSVISRLNKLDESEINQSRVGSNVPRSVVDSDMVESIVESDIKEYHEEAAMSESNLESDISYLSYYQSGSDEVTSQAQDSIRTEEDEEVVKRDKTLRPSGTSIDKRRERNKRHGIYSQRISTNETDARQIPMKPLRWKQFVVAIDFGTTYSGYAYQFIEDFKRNPIGGKTAIWHGDSFLSEKAPTSILVNTFGDFDSFGFEAETKYMQLIEKDEGEGWRFFKQFKMELYDDGKNTISRNFQIRDHQGKSMPAEKVFGFGIQFLKNKAFEAIKSSMPDLQEERIFYVVTVPAIWSDRSRQFMLEALRKAGVDTDQAILAKEPEVAAIYCKERQQHLHEVNKTYSSYFRFEPGSKFIVLDLGGGTTDIAVNEVTGDRRLRMLRSASGGPWGGTNIDKEYLSLIKEVVGGEQIFQSLIQTNQEDYLELVRNWEMKKRQTAENENICETSIITVTLPLSFIPKVDNDEISTSKGILRFKGNKLRMPVLTFNSLFATSAQNITDHLLTITKDLEDIDTIFMVGGLSCSSYIQNAIRTSLPGMTVIIPQSPTLAVLFGALIYGFHPEIIEERISAFHYGIEEDGLFRVLISKGQGIKIGERVAEQKLTRRSAANCVRISIYASERKIAPKYVCDCNKLGEISVQTERKQTTNEIEITLAVLFDTTEVNVEAMDATNGKFFITTCDFLG